MTRRTLLRSSLALLVSGPLSGCLQGPVKELRGALQQLSSDVASMVAELEMALARLTGELQRTVGESVVQLRAMQDSLQQFLSNTVAQVTATLRATVESVLSTAKTLVADLQQGIREAIERTAKLLREMIDRVFASLQSVIDETLRQAENTGGRLIGRAANETHVWLGAGLGGALAIVGAVGSVTVLVRSNRQPGGGGRRGATVALVALLALGLVIAFSSRKLALALGQQVELPDGHALCAKSSELSRRFTAALVKPLQVVAALEPPEVTTAHSFVDPRQVLACSAARIQGQTAPQFEPSVRSSCERVTRVVKSDGPEAMRSLLRGGAARRLLLRGERLANGASALEETGTAARAPEEDALSRLANDAKAAAAQCIAAAPTKPEADEARAAYLLASDYLGAPIRCVTDRDCAPGKLCRTSTAECLARGIYCRGPEDCAQGSECSTAHDECVRRDGFRCQRSEQCRVGEACQTGTDACVELDHVEGSACEVQDELVKGLCRTQPGQWTNTGARLECRPTILPGERTDDSCNGIDDNCDGAIDEAFRGGTPCDVPTGTVQGECVHGQTVCLEGRPDCRPSARNPSEICGDDKDNDCNGKTDDGCAPVPQKEVCDGTDNDLNGVVDDRIDCHSIVVTFNDVDDDAVVWRGDTSDGNKICSVSLAAGGMGACNLNQRAIAAGVSEPSNRYFVKFGNGGCWNSSGSVTITVDGNTVLNQGVGHAIRHCGWFYRAIFDVNLARGEFSLVESRDCGLPTDCM